MGIDEARPRQRFLQGHEIEHPHALAFDTDAGAFAELWQCCPGFHEGTHVAILVAPVENGAGKIQRRERAHLEIGHDCHRLTIARYDHLERPLHLMEVGAEHPAEIGAGHEDDGIELGGGEDGMERGEIGHECRLATFPHPVTPARVLSGSHIARSRNLSEMTQ